MKAPVEGRMKIGLMSFAHTHAQSYCAFLRDHADVELLTADPDGASGPADETRGAAYAAELGVDYVETYEELLTWGPDAVVICSENARHRAATELAAAAGAHVLCEKPLATSVEDAEAMIAACEAAGVFLMTAFPVHFAPSYAALKAAIAAGKLGRVVGATGTNNGWLPAGRAWFAQPELSGGGALVDHTVHVAELLDGIVPANAVKVRAATNQVLHSDRAAAGVETAGLVSITYGDGTEAVIDCSWSQPPSAPTWGGLTLEVVGTKGIARIDPFDARVGGYDEATGKDFWLPTGPGLDGLMLAEFLRGVRSGVGPQPDGAAGLRAVRIVAAAQESAAHLHTARPVTPAGDRID